MFLYTFFLFELFQSESRQNLEIEIFNLNSSRSNQDLYLWITHVFPAMGHDGGMPRVRVPMRIKLSIARGEKKVLTYRTWNRFLFSC